MASTNIMESPFTWDIHEDYVLNESYDDMIEQYMLEEEIPFLSLFNSLMLSYFYIMKSNYNDAILNLSKTDDIWRTINQKELEAEGCNVKVIFEVVQNTKASVLLLAKGENPNLKVRDEISPSISLDVEVKNEKYESTLHGCKSAAWSTMHCKTLEKSIYFARLAISADDTCTIWKLLLGKNLRRLRRTWDHNVDSVSSEEFDLFNYCYSTRRNNATYGLYLAHACHESHQYSMASRIYNEVLALEPQSINVRLKLILGCLRMKKMREAKICLDYVEKVDPTNSTFLHFKGLYFMHLKRYEEACEYFKVAAKYIFSADLLYGRCRKKIDDDFCLIFHFIYMKKKYKTIYEQQLLSIYIGLEFFNSEKYSKALKYFVNAKELNPNSYVLRKIYNYKTNERMNISTIIELSLAGMDINK